MVPTQGGSVYTKFEVDSSFRSKVIRGPKFRPPKTPFPGARDGQNLISWTFTYKPSLVRIDARNFELSW